MSTPGKQPSDSNIHLDPAIRPQTSGNLLEAGGFDACQRALGLLERLHRHQECLPRPAALAWERTAFSETFDHPEPGRRIRRFLGKV